MKEVLILSIGCGCILFAITSCPPLDFAGVDAMLKEVAEAQLHDAPDAGPILPIRR